MKYVNVYVACFIQRNPNTHVQTGASGGRSCSSPIGSQNQEPQEGGLQLDLSRDSGGCSLCAWFCVCGVQIS